MAVEDVFQAVFAISTALSQIFLQTCAQYYMAASHGLFAAAAIDSERPACALLRADHPMSLLDDLTARGVQIRTRLRELLQPHSFYNSTKERLLAGYVAIALEHHCAIWLLTERHKHGAALSLVRTVMDAWLHALWINKMATAAQMEKAWLGELKLPMSQMREQIKKAYFGAHTDSDPERAEKVDAFFQSLKDRWKTFSGYTHPSGLQVSRRFTGDKVKANYGEGDIAETLDQATTTLMQLAQAYFVSMAKLPEAREVRTLYAQYCADFDDRLKRLAQAE